MERKALRLAHNPVAEALGDERIGFEARAQQHDHVDLKIWLRLLACSTQIEKIIRQRLRSRFATTLPRFDYLAQLDRHPQGLRMKVLSSYLMVTGGNVTAVTDQLVKEGLVMRSEDPDDRRSFRVSLTDKGKREFAEMAGVHEQWLRELLAGLPKLQKDDLFDQLGRLRLHLARQPLSQDDEDSDPAPTPRRRKS